MNKNFLKIFLIVTIILLNFVIYKDSLNALLSVQGKNLVKAEDYSVNRGTFEELRTKAIDFSGWSDKEKLGLFLESEQKGTVIYSFERPDDTQVVTLQTYFTLTPNGKNELSISKDRLNWIPLTKDRYVGLTPISITSFIPEKGNFFVKFEAENTLLKEQNAPPSLILQGLQVNFFHKDVQIPSLPFILISIFLPIYLISYVSKKTNSKILLLIIPLIPIIALNIIRATRLNQTFFYPHTSPFNYTLLFQFLVIGIIIFLEKFHTKLIAPLLLLLVMTIGLHASLNELYQNLYFFVEPDVICIMDSLPNFDIKSERLGLFGNFCGTKESATAIMYLASYKIFGFNSDLGVKFSTIFFHVLTVALVFIFGKAIRSNLTGLTAGLIIATQPYLVNLSTRGLRDTPFTFAITLFIFFLFGKNLSILKNLFYLLVSMILVIYIRLHALIQLAPIIVIFSLSKSILLKSTGILKQATFILMLLILISLPIILVNLKYYKIWNISERMHTRWNANVEFAGKPGFPSSEEVAKSSFQGEPISTFTYFFKLHTPQDLVISSFKGMIKTFKNLYFPNNISLLLFFILGTILMLKAKRLWYIPFFVFFLEIPHFFFIQKDLVEYRSLTQSLPFIALTVGYATEAVLNLPKIFLQSNLSNTLNQKQKKNNRKRN